MQSWVTSVGVLSMTGFQPNEFGSRENWFFISFFLGFSWFLLDDYRAIWYNIACWRGKKTKRPPTQKHTETQIKGSERKAEGSLSLRVTDPLSK